MIDAGEVRLDGALGDAELLRDLFGGIAPGDGGEYLDFALRQIGRCFRGDFCFSDLRRIQQFLEDLGFEERLAPRGCPDGVEQRGAVGIFEQIAARTGLQALALLLKLSRVGRMKGLGYLVRESIKSFGQRDWMRAFGYKGPRSSQELLS